MAILSKGWKPDDFESHDSLKLSFNEYLGPSFKFCWLWIFPWIKLKLSWHSCSKANQGDSIDSGNFSVRGLSSFNPKGFYYSYAWSRSLCEGRTSFCIRLISRKLQILTYVFDWLYFFFLYWSPSSSLHMVFHSISSNIDRWGSLNQPIC